MRRLLSSFCVVIAISLLLPCILMADDYEKARVVLKNSLIESFEGIMQSWQIQYIDKPSFPYIVEKQARRVQAEANHMTESNQRAAIRCTTMPLVRMHIINAMAEAGIESKTNEACVEAIYNKLKANASKIGNFYIGGYTLAVVGWGEGDHVNIDGYVPLKPSSVSKKIVDGVVELLQ
ncbi:MAG: hypothetical protein HQM10_25145 [Candidatus Riflebacteria bacterium]|nr:hypothetical protein [Candidatus Riflebacteria bacterium]